MIRDWEKNVQAYLEFIANGCPEELRPDQCLFCLTEGKMHRHGKFLRTVYTFCEAILIPIFRFRCYECKHTVSILPSFIGSHQQAVWDAQEEIIRQNETGASLDKVAGGWKATFVPFSVKTLWRWKKQWDNRLQSFEGAVWTNVIKYIPHLQLPVGAQSPKSRWQWLFTLWEQLNSRHPQGFGLLHWLSSLARSESVAMTG